MQTSESRTDTTSMDLAVEDLEFRFGEDFALRVPRLLIPTGDTAVCIGPSGSGKSTLVRLLAGILLAEQGQVTLGGTDWAGLSDRQRRLRRITRIGLVFQEFELLDHLSVLENILLPYHVQSDLRIDRNARDRALDLARIAGIDRLVRRKPRHLSQGERQRVAICRALVTEPEVVLADEPTGNLDPGTTETVFELLRSQVRERQATLVMVTHDHSLLESFDRVIEFDTENGSSRASERAPSR